jgi:uncharacterized SAM-binding protein YcdF (DUF218 family)
VPRHPRWSGRQIVVIGVVLGLLAFAADTARLFIFPVTGAPAHADAILVLAGDAERARLGEALRLFARHVAPILVVSDPSGRVDPAICGDPYGAVRHICFAPNPVTTQGEAEEFSIIARAFQWRSVVVVSTRFQATRARIRVRRCFRGRISVAGVSPELEQWPGRVAYEWGAMAKAMFLQRRC